MADGWRERSTRTLGRPRGPLLIGAAALLVLAAAALSRLPHPGPEPAAAPGTPSSAGARGPAGAAPGTVQLPPANATFDYQLGGAYPPMPGAGIVDRDHTESPAPGVYTVCYLNAFQTQPGAVSQWPAGTLLHTAAGALVQDPAWPGEYLLDTRTATTRAAVMRVLTPWLDECARKGFRAVEPDNLDSWTRSGGLLRQEDNVALAVAFTRAAHTLGLAVAQKNAAELAPIGRSTIGFDFAIAEECQPNAECDAYTEVYGQQVYEIEYPDHGGVATFRAACAARGARISVLYRDRMVVPAGADGYTSQTC